MWGAPIVGSGPLGWADFYILGRCVTLTNPCHNLTYSRPRARARPPRAPSPRGRARDSPTRLSASGSACHPLGPCLERRIIWRLAGGSRRAPPCPGKARCPAEGYAYALRPESRPPRPSRGACGTLCLITIFLYSLARRRTYLASERRVLAILRADSHSRQVETQNPPPRDLENIVFPLLPRERGRKSRGRGVLETCLEITRGPVPCGIDPIQCSSIRRKPTVAFDSVQRYSLLYTCTTLNL